MLLAGVGLGAEGALVRRLPGVLVHVVGEVLLAGELLRAIRALERSLARMQSAVNTFRLSAFTYLLFNCITANGTQSECNVCWGNKINLPRV